MVEIVKKLPSAYEDRLIVHLSCGHTHALTEYEINHAHCCCPWCGENINTKGVSFDIK